MEPPVWLGLLAAFGLGSIIAAVVAAISGRAVAIAQLRQAWINALRDDIAEYLRQIDLYTGRVEGGRQAAQHLDERHEALKTYRRIVLRLNLTEPLHRDLVTQMQALQYAKTAATDADQVDGVLHIAQQVLKLEWDVTKWGMLRRPRAWLLGRASDTAGPNPIAAIHDRVRNQRAIESAPDDAGEA